jgi:predicted RNA-binding protein with RPS1 domain
VGFLRVSGSTNPLDLTRIHPRFYPIASAICQQMDIKVPDLATDEGRAAVEDKRSKVKLAELEKEFDVHYLLLKEMIDEMAHPWADPRENREGPVLRQERLTLQTLEPENWYMGTVRNIVDFGVFVDVGVGEDGLVHISELSDQYVESPYDIVSVGDRVRVRVVRVEEDRGRIALSMREESPQRRPRRDRPPRKSSSSRRSDSRQPATTKSGSSSGGSSDSKSSGGGIPSDRAEAAVAAASHGPKSTRGMDSRRVQRASLAEHIARNQNRPVSVSSGGSGGAENKPEESEGAEETPQAQEGSLGGLLGKLDFANIERRGEGREDEEQE